MKHFLACVAVALLAIGCNSNDRGGGTPTDPSQVNIEFTATDLVVGTGAQAGAGNAVTMNFELWLFNQAGTESKGNRIQGSSDPNIGAYPFTIGVGSVITGVDQGIRGMRVGGKRRLYIPSSLAYGPPGNGPIPPNAAIVFEIELLTVQ